MDDRDMSEVSSGSEMMSVSESVSASLTGSTERYIERMKLCDLAHRSSIKITKLCVRNSY